MTATNRENDFVYVIIILRIQGVLYSFSVRSPVRASNNTFLATSINVTKPSVYTFVRQISNIPLLGFSCLWRQIGRLLNIGYKTQMSQRYPTCYLFDCEECGVGNEVWVLMRVNGLM